MHYCETYNDQPFRFIWQAFSADNSPTNIKIETSVQVYRNKPIVYFTIDYISGLTNASIPGVINQALSSYPSFILEDGDMKKGFVTWSKGRKCRCNLCTQGIIKYDPTSYQHIGITIIFQKCPKALLNLLLEETLVWWMFG